MINPEGQLAKRQWAQSWAERHDLPPETLKESGGRCCLVRLTGGQCDARVHYDVYPGGICRDGIPGSPPRADHCSLWLWRGEPVVYVSQPYGLGPDGFSEHQRLLACGFEVAVDTWPAWHYPGHVLFVEYTFPARLAVLRGARS